MSIYGLNNFEASQQKSEMEGKLKDKAGNTNWRKRVSTVNLLIKVACSVRKIGHFYNKQLPDLD